MTFRNVSNRNAHVIGLPQGSTPGLTRGICQGIQGDGMGSLPLGRGKFKRLFQNQWIGMGEHLDITGTFTACTEGENSNCTRSAVSIVSPCYVSLTVSYCSRLESYLFICKLRAWFVSRLTIYEQGAFGKLADTSRNHKTRLWLTVKRLKMFIWLLYNWIVHSIMKFGDFVIFQSRAWFFTALSLGLGFSNKGLGESRILPFAN